MTKRPAVSSSPVRRKRERLRRRPVLAVLPPKPKSKSKSKQPTAGDIDIRRRAIAAMAEKKLDEATAALASNSPVLTKAGEIPKLPSHVGNQYWLLNLGGDDTRIFDTPEIMAEKAQAYFDWVEANPIVEKRVAQYLGEQVDLKVDKMRPMSVKGMCQYIGMTVTSWQRYRKKEGYQDMAEAIEGVIYTQKFEGAAAGLFNAMIVARDLGLREHTDVTSDGAGVTQIIRRVIDDAETREPK